MTIQQQQAEILREMAKSKRLVTLTHEGTPQWHEAEAAALDAGAAALSRQREQDDHGAAAVQAIEQFAAGWDESGLVGIREPYRWETVARACLDVLRSIAVRHIAIHGVQPLAVQPSAALSQPSRQLENDHGGTSLTEGDAVSGSVPTGQLPHDAIEVRLIGGADARWIDEIVASNARVHLEAMSRTEYALIIDTPSQRACYSIHAANSRSHIRATETWIDPVGSVPVQSAERADATGRSEAQESISHSDQSAALVPQGWRESRLVPVDDGEAMYVICDGSPYLMHYRAEHNLWEMDGELFQVSHVMPIPPYRHLFPAPPLSPAPPPKKYHAVTPPMMPAPYQPPRDISDQVFPKPEEKS